MEFLKINNRKNFIIKEIPIINPASRKYLTFWTSQKKRIIDGFWSIDEAGIDVDITLEQPDFPKSNSWRYMPPVCYFYANFGTILVKKRGAASGAKIPSRPNLDDVEWEFNYNWIEARGFSGFEFDEEYSCNKFLMQGLSDDELTHRCLDKNGDVIDFLYNNFFKKNGDRKTYVPARTYLRKLFSKPLGRPIYANVPKNLMLLGTRDGGKSWLSASCVAHEILTDGVRMYEKNMSELPVAEVVVGSAISDKSRDLLKKTVFIMDNLPGKYNRGTKYEIPCPFYKAMTGSIGANKDYVHLYKKKVGGEMKDVGTGAIIKHRIFTTENPEAAAGGRPGTIIIEEVGLCFSPNTEVRMHDLSIKKISDVVIGDFVMSSSGKKSEVIAVTSGKSEMYKVSQKYGDDYIVSKNHILYLNEKYKNYGQSGANPVKYLVQDFNTSVINESRFSETYGIANDLLEFDVKNNLKIEPYFLGAWIGDGDSDGTTICASFISEPLIRYIYEYSERLGMFVKEDKISNNFGRYSIVKYFGNNGIHKVNTVNNVNYLRQSLREYGLVKNKRIPIDYQFSSVENRLELLAGLLDTDGCLITGKSNQFFEFYQTNREELVEDVRLLAKNLGFRVSKRIRRINTGFDGKILNEYRNKTTLSISGDVWKIPTKIEYKQAKYRKFKKHINSTPISIEKIGIGKYCGFKLKEDPLFLLKDGTIVHNCSNLISVHSSNTAAQNDSGEKFGSSLYVGTAGSIDKIRDAELIFGSPEGFEMLEFDNIWEPEVQNKICWFIPAPYMARDFKDSNGNTNLANATKFFERRRSEASKSPSKKAYEMEKMNYPLIPSEMFVNADSNIFPTSDIKHHYSRLMSSRKLLDLSYKVEFIIKEDGKIDFKNIKKEPIREYPFKPNDKNDISGCVEIFAMPVLDGDGNVPSNVYIAGYDPIDDDDNSDVTRSLQSFWIMNRLTGELCLEYTGRTPMVAEFYEQARRALIYYNAKCNYENNKKGFFAHLYNKACLYLLVETPEILLQKDVQKSRGVGNKSLGTNANTDVITLGLDYILQWLTEQAENHPVGVMNLHTIKSPALLREFLSFKPSGNFDRISALVMLFILREDKRRIVTDIKKRHARVLDDPFFTDRYENNKY